MPRAKRYGDPEIARRLKRARLAHGKAGASAAAQAMGVSVGTYKSHESGMRFISEADLCRYSAFFNVEKKWLVTGVAEAAKAPAPAELARGSEDASEKLTRQNFIGNRLSAARRLAGFMTASEACRHFGWHRGTYGSHEYGRSLLLDGWSEVYAAAFGVDADWLTLRSSSSGHPSKADALILSAEKAASWSGSGDTRYRAWRANSLHRQLNELGSVRRRGNKEDVDRIYGKVKRSEKVSRGEFKSFWLFTLPSDIACVRLRRGQILVLQEIPSPIVRGCYLVRVENHLDVVKIEDKYDYNRLTTYKIASFIGQIVGVGQPFKDRGTLLSI